MNITINEALQSNNANMMKLRKAPSAVSNTPMPQPESAANLAFTSVVSKPAANALKLLAAGAATAFAMNSCVQYPELERSNISISNEITIDMSMWNEMVAALRAELQQSRQQDSIQHANDAKRDSIYHAETMSKKLGD